VNGEFESPVLITGDYLVAIRPMTAVPAAELPEYLAALRKTATRVTVNTGEKARVTLTLK